MNVIRLLNELADQGIKLAADGDQLRIRAPKGALTQQHRAWITEHRDTLLTLLRQDSGNTEQGAAGLPRLVPRPEERHLPFPLTDIQQAYWVGRMGAFHQGDISIYLYVELDCKRLDLPRLEAAWQRMIERHDMLRAIIRPDGQQQILMDVPEYRFTRIDLTRAAPRDAAARLDAIREEMSHRVMPTDRWPGFDIRASLLADDRTRLHISMDLVNIDGASTMMLLTEWVRSYDDPTAQFEPFTISYRDYALAEAALHESQSYQESLAYWRKRVEQLPPAPELPLAVSPGELTRTRFVHRTAKIALDVWDRVKARAAEHDLTSAALLAAIYAEVLATWSRRPDFTLNVTVYNRLPFHPEVDRIIGDFTSMILLGVDTAAHPTFLERVRAIQRQLWSDLEHHQVSGVQVLRELARVQRQYDGAVMPIVFTNMLGLRSKGFSSLYTSLESLGEIAHLLMMTPQVWIDYQVHEDAEGLRLSWDTVEGLFPPGMIDDMLAAYCRLIERLADDPASWQTLRHDLLPPAQQARYDALNATEVPVPEVLLHTLVAEQAAQRPDHPAVIAPERTLTHGELQRHVQRLGRRLRELGARPNTLVAIVMEKGWEQIAAALGIHAAGAAYLPIDPAVPPERLAYLLEHGQVQVALTQPWLDSRLAWPAHVRRLGVEDPEVLACDDRPLAPVQHPGDLAYVIYTSGSTGLPKGVMIEQRSVVNRMLDVNRRAKIGPNDRILALSALHHDLSVYDVFGILAAGGTAVMPAAASVRDPAHWAALLAVHRITLWNSVPMFLEMLVEHLEHVSPSSAALPRNLRWAILAGDWIPVTLPDRLRALVPNVEIIASGGPTETTIWDIWYPVDEVDPAWKSIPYGQPMANTRYHVLDDALQPRPVWVPGQLYIGGVGLARGYWRDEERTKASFIIHPRTGERLYRSGDLGRWLPDGNIEFLGREDGQVKVGGHRIEVGEIEAALTQHAGIHAAVVVAKGEPPGPRQLVAYVVPTHADEVQPDAPVSAYGTGPGTLVDPAERLAFKLERRHLRADLTGRPGIALPRPVVDDALVRAYDERRSQRQFATEPVALADLSALLATLMGLERDGWPRHRYASAGSLYPVQVYLYIAPGRVQGLSGGTFHYHPLEHRLIELTPDARIAAAVHAPHNQPVFESSAFSIFLIGQLQAIQPLYGAVSRDFCLLEAGYMSQLLMTQAHAHGLGLCPIGGLAFDDLRDLFQLEDSHVLLHSHVGGRLPAPGQDHAAGDSHASRLSEAELRAYLRRKLPEPLVPAAIVFLEHLPLSANGKVDRKALHALELAQTQTSDAEAAPQSELEQTIAGVVCEVLHLDSLGAGQNFFDLGGNSVHIVRIAARLRDVLGRDLSVTEIFRNPTVRFLAQVLSGQDQTGQARVTAAAERGQARRQARVPQRDALRQRRERAQRGPGHDDDGGSQDA